MTSFNPAATDLECWLPLGTHLPCEVLQVPRQAIREHGVVAHGTGREAR